LAIISVFLADTSGAVSKHAGGSPGAIYKQTEGKQSPAFEVRAQQFAVKVKYVNFSLCLTTISVDFEMTSIGKSLF
jgi:hypothetical protein